MSYRSKPRWTGWYVCEWRCGAKFRRGYDYSNHVLAKHDFGMEPQPDAMPMPGLTLRDLSTDPKELER